MPIALLAAIDVYAYEPTTIPGTHLQMELRALFQWDGFSNTFAAIGFSGNMVPRYIRRPIREAIDIYRPFFLNPFLSPALHCEVEKEGYEASDRYMLLCRAVSGNKAIGHSFILFVGDEGATYIIESKVFGGEGGAGDSSVGRRILDAYAGCKVASGKDRIGTELFYSVRSPDGFALIELAGSRTTYEIAGTAGKTAGYVTLSGFRVESDMVLENYLPPLISAGSAPLSSGPFGGKGGERASWKRISFDPGMGEYRIQYVVRQGKCGVRIDSSIHAGNYEIMRRRMDALARDVRIKHC